ncbi:hypothetical protein J7L67_06035, partial [bacterium]|nr:hypothetical protein [bacterium]
MKTETNMEEEYIKYIKKNRVFILGAGFSAEANIPLTNELLKLTMEKCKAECPGLYERINNYAKLCFCCDSEIDYSKVNFSDLCTFLEYIELREYGGGERWSEAGCREKLTLRFFLAKTIAERTPRDEAIPEIYIRFAEQLHEKDIVISFNWDCLLETTLEKIGKKYTYNFEKNKIKLRKLHGSVNWRLGKPEVLGKPITNNILKWEPVGFANGLMPIDTVS